MVSTGASYSPKGSRSYAAGAGEAMGACFHMAGQVEPRAVVKCGPSRFFGLPHTRRVSVFRPAVIQGVMSALRRPSALSSTS